MAPLGFLFGLLATWQQKDLGEITFSVDSDASVEL